MIAKGEGNKEVVELLISGAKENQVANPNSSSTKSTGAGKSINRKESDPTILNDVISDYLTLIVWMINREHFSTVDVWKTGRSLLYKHHFAGAKGRGTVEVPESFQAVLIRDVQEIRPPYFPMIQKNYSETISLI